MAQGLEHFLFDMPVTLAIGFHVCVASVVCAAGAHLGGGRRMSCWAALVCAVFVSTLSSLYNLDQDTGGVRTALVPEWLFREMTCPGCSRWLLCCPPAGYVWPTVPCPGSLRGGRDRMLLQVRQTLQLQQ
jgi:hypothetical protein